MGLRLIADHTSRAAALLGDEPTLTLMADGDVCCTVRLVRAGDVWLGVASDHALVVDRVRMGVVPRFLFGAVSGTANTRVLGKVSAVSGDVAQAVRALSVGRASDVVIEVSPHDLVVDADDTAIVVPRT